MDENYPVPAFCFEIPRHTSVQSLWKVLDYFLKKSIAHNILLTKIRRVDGRQDTVNVIVWPRRNSTGAKKLEAFNVAVLELSGWFPIFGNYFVIFIMQGYFQQSAVSSRYQKSIKGASYAKLLYKTRRNVDSKSIFCRVMRTKVNLTADFVSGKN